MNDYLYITIQQVNKDKIDTNHIYNAPAEEYDNILNNLIAVDGMVYETYCNKQLTNCNIILHNQLINIEKHWDYEPRHHLNKSLQNFYQEIKKITS